MPRNASEDESAPITPSKKTPNRAKNRQIVRWTDEKLAFAFSEFRLACQKHRIDVKKPLEDAAKAIAPFVTGDALIQQLSKRRVRYIEEHKDDEDLPTRTLLPSSAKASPASPAAGKTGTPKRRKTALQHELEDLKDVLSPSATTAAATAAADAAVATVAGTTASSAKRGKPRATTKGRAKDLEEIKKELSSDSESEYTESSAKARKKRVRSRKASSKKKNYADYADEDEDGFADESAFVQECEQEPVTDGDEYVDAAGGTNVFVKTASSSEPSPTSAKFPSGNYAGKTVGGKHYGGSHAMGGKSVAGYTPDPKAIAAVAAARREDSFAATTPDTSEMGSFVNAPVQNSYGVEDVFVDQNGTQTVQQNHMFMGGQGGSFHQMGGIGFGSFPPGNLMMNSFYNNPPFNADAMLANQVINPAMAQGHVNGQIQGNGHALVHTTSNSNSDSSLDAQQASTRSSFTTSNPSFYSSNSDPTQAFQVTHTEVDGRLSFSFDDAGGYDADNDDTPTSKNFLGNEMGGFGLGL